MSNGIYRSGYTMPLEIHHEMRRAMKLSGDTNVSKYITRAVRAENKKYLTTDIETFLSNCSTTDLEVLEQELKKIKKGGR